MSNPYDDLFAAYLDELRKARDEALAWWERLEIAEGRDIDAARAHAAVRTRWPAGPASFPRVIAVYREFFLKCEALNDAQEEAPSAAQAGWGEDDETDAPVTMNPHYLIDNLDAADPELSKFMEAFVFSCVAVDEEGRSV